MTLRTSQRLLLAKIESSYGTNPTPAGTDAVLVRNMEITPLQADAVERELIRGYMGNYDILLANQRVEINFEIELAGSGAAGTAPKWDAIIRSCGNSVTTVASTRVTYAPISSSFESSTLEYYVDGVRHRLTGCRGSFSISAEVGQIPVMTFSMIGLFNAPTDTSNPSTTYSNQVAPVIFKNGNTTNFTLFGYAGALQSFNFDQSNTTVYRELVGGTKEVLITDRRPNGTIMLEAELLATHNFFSDATGSSTGTNTFQHGQSAGNIVTFSAPQTDLGSPSYSDSDGIQMLNLPYNATPTTAGNNEYSLVCT